METARWLATLSLESKSDAGPNGEQLNPIVRRLVAGWNDVASRFIRRPGDRFVDFGVDDALKIALLAALTFDRDFDGAELDLSYPWDSPTGTDATFDGRFWAWAKITTGVRVESWLLKLVRLAAEYLPDAAQIKGGAQDGSHKSIQEVDQAIPVWDCDRRELSFRGQLCKAFQNHAVNQWAVLDAFQEQEWPSRIDDPLTGKRGQDHKRRLQRTIIDLKKRMNGIRFRGDRTGEGVLWEPTDSAPVAHQ